VSPLLFDENLSAHLPRLVADQFAGGLHVRDVGLARADDSAVWEYARTHGMAIVTKDDDFRQRSFLYGSPPKVIWVHLELQHGRRSGAAHGPRGGDTGLPRRPDEQPLGVATIGVIAARLVEVLTPHTMPQSRQRLGGKIHPPSLLEKQLSFSANSVHLRPPC